MHLPPAVSGALTAVFALLAALPAFMVEARERCAPPAVLGQIFVPPAPCYRMHATFALPTARYPHGVLGDRIEYGGIVANEEQLEVSLALPQRRVFEDLAPRLADLDGSGRPEIVVVESDAQQGAMLAVYRAQFGPPHRGIARIAATEPIGQRFRWLAPIGIADFNGDGQNDVAYIETPHLGKILRIVTLQGDRMVEIAAAPGFSNHRIGEAFISGGVRDCGDGPETVTADAGWRRIMAARLVAGRIEARDLGPFAGPESFAAALACR
ncbi:MAG: VCBS repeat-containing protein [Pseudomonadota bacterium]